MHAEQVIINLDSKKNFYYNMLLLFKINESWDKLQISILSFVKKDNFGFLYFKNRLSKDKEIDSIAIRNEW